ncbi:hypothetical protein PT285_00645 [Lactobacillus sp. ESL0791]|nr:hypothetical protein [Lactobacillus sp. ESL0791]MDF7637946.1 hypothetical protein [Lactobacillus sp. ESL0791]
MARNLFRKSPLLVCLPGHQLNAGFWHVAYSPCRFVRQAQQEVDMKRPSHFITLASYRTAFSV